MFSNKLDSAKFFLKCDLRSQKATNIPCPFGMGMFVAFGDGDGKASSKKLP
ncbi:MAG: hypothetical protein WA883_11995 [Phormidesmis sp.]